MGEYIIVKHIVTFSGGKDSTCMLLKMIENNMPIDEIIFCDTGMEFPETYRHIQKVEKYINRKVTILRDEHDLKYYATKYILKSGKYKGNIGYGFPRVTVRWCTKTLKIAVMNRYYKEKYKGEEIHQYIGIAADEVKRIKPIKNIFYPLNDMGITEEQALEYCKSKGFNWDGLYEHVGRLSCYCCPLCNLDTYRYLYFERPELWNNIKEMESQIQWHDSFTQRYSTSDLEIRFNLEKQYKSQSKRTSSRAFFKELKEILKK